jgi:putative ribosome biogenesis GTPase RsgA
LDKVCREEMGNGAFIQEVIHHFKYNASMIVRGRLSALLAALARTSSRHRVKIINNEGMNVLLEALDPQFSDAIVDNALVSLQHVLGGARTARPF